MPREPRRARRTIRRPRRRVRGFTLVELAFVLVVLTILAGVSVPALGWLQSARTNVVATRIRSALVLAQQWALGAGDRTWVAFDAANDLVSVHVEDRANPGRTNRLILPDPLTRAPMTLAVGAPGTAIVAVDMGGTAEVEFDALGAPRDATGAALTTDGVVTLSGGARVRVSRGTGLVTVD